MSVNREKVYFDIELALHQRYGCAPLLFNIIDGHDID